MTQTSNIVENTNVLSDSVNNSVLSSFAKTWDLTDSLGMINIWGHSTCLSCGCSSTSLSGSVSAFAPSFPPLKSKSIEHQLQSRLL